MSEDNSVDDFFEEAYEHGEPPWDIGRPQDEIVRLAEAGEIRGSVLDVGCGTGENAIYVAKHGHEVWGIDSASTAIERAKAKAAERGVKATFLVFDALSLRNLGRTFDTVIDSGFFHTLSDEERPKFAKGLAVVLRSGGTYFMLCFSENEPGVFGPRRVTQVEIRDTFRRGWKVDYIREARFTTRIGAPGAYAWLASITKTGTKGART